MPEPTTEEKPEPTPARHSKVAEVIDAFGRLARLTPQQLLTLVTILLCVSVAYQAYTDRQERKEVSQERKDAAATQIRESNAELSLTRQHCAEQVDKVLRRETERARQDAEERAKDRAVMSQLVAKLGDLERAMSKRPNGQPRRRKPRGPRRSSRSTARA